MYPGYLSTKTESQHDQRFRVCVLSLIRRNHPYSSTAAGAAAAFATTQGPVGVVRAVNSLVRHVTHGDRCIGVLAELQRFVG
jgi:hypothetical protein